MTPLDDELRRTLSSRATALAPPSDPLAGIEARASRLRRRRVAAAVAGTAALVAAVALAVPALVPDRKASPPPRFAVTTTPTAAPDPAPPGATPSNALDTGDDQGQLVVPGSSKVADAWTAKHPGAEPAYTRTLLTGRIGTTSPVSFVIVELWRQGGAAYAVVAQDTDTTPVLVRDAVLPAASPFIDGIVSGGANSSSVVYALARGVRQLVYDRGDGQTATVGSFATDGSNTGHFDRTGPTNARDTLTATFADARTVKQVVWLGPNDDHQPPADLVTWLPRGDAAAGPQVGALLTAFAKQRGADPADAAYQAVYTAATSSGVRYTIGQVWITGDANATSVGYATGGTAGATLRTYPSTTSTSYGIAALLTDLPGSTTDLLVVVPRPGVGQVSWSASSTGALQPVASGRSDLNGIALIDRAKNETNDRLEVLDGDGNLDRPLYRGLVAPLLCDRGGC